MASESCIVIVGVDSDIDKSPVNANAPCVVIAPTLHTVSIVAPLAGAVSIVKVVPLTV